MWQEAFESVATDVERLSREVDERVAEDPLASIGMARPETKPPATKGKGKGPMKSKRGREEEGAAAAAAASAVDPFARRKTRPTSYWSVGQEKMPSTEEVRSRVCPF